MNKKVYKNITRFSLPVIIKTADGIRTNSFTLPPTKTFEITEIQTTGDVRVKVKNGLLQLVSEEMNVGSTTEFPKVTANTQKPVQKVVASKATPTPKVHTSTYPTAGNKDVKFTSKEIDNS